MRGDIVVHSQLMLAQAIGQLAKHIEDSTGYQLTPIIYDQLPTPPQEGMIAWITDASLMAGGGSNVVVGGGSRHAMVVYDGSSWLSAAVKGTGWVHLGVTTWAALPAPPQKGMLAAISDSNRNSYGQTITGSGSYFVLALYDGTNWVVH